MANEKNDSHQWFLRIAGGTVFGPVSTKGLIVWAEQGRIVPGNEVSNNRENWIPAEQIPELEMNWYVNAGSKTEGPFNRIAAESFLKSSKAPSDARMLHARDVDPAVLARRNQPEAPAEPAPEAKAPASNRHAAARPADAKGEPDTRDRRIAELEAALEKQREAVAQARQAAKSQAALEDERDQVRKQTQDLQAQLESVRANAEKDAQKRERKLDALRQEVARLQQEQEDARSRPMLELDAAATASATEDARQQAIEELRRQAEDEHRLREREADALRARIQQLEQELAQAAAAAGEAHAHANANQQQECDTLRQKLAAAQAETEASLTRAARLDQQVAELASQLGQHKNEHRKLMTDCELLQQQLSLAMSNASDAANETVDGDLRRRVEQLDAITAGLRQELAQTDQALVAERTALTDLLAASNERDLINQQRIKECEQRQSELDSQLQESGTTNEREARLSAELAAARARIAELQVRLARQPESTAARTPEAVELWLRQFATDELTTLDKALHEERDSFNHFRELSASRQESIQSRIQVLQRLLSGDHPDGRRASHGPYSSGLDQTRLRSEVDAMRETQQKESRQFEEREGELLRRIRLLETEETRLRSLLEATDMEGGKRIELMETIRRREQELAQERRNRDQDREQSQLAQQALLRRIEELERNAGISGEAASAGSRPDEPSGAAQPRRPASLGNWWKR
ncbi:MAG: hypothetical protein ACOYOU_01255 [Kiritimatiellia bacterium]